MKENIVIPIKIERVKAWIRRGLMASTWLICLGLLATGLGVAGFGALAWLASGSEYVLTLGIVGGLLLGLAGVWQLLHQMDRAIGLLRHEPSAVREDG